MSVDIKKIRANVAGSLKKIIPIRTVPTAPIPVHTGYAVPNGIDWVAFASNPMLKTVKRRKPAIQAKYSIPDTSFARPRQYVKPTSHSPAIIRIIQFISKCNPIEGCSKNRRLLPRSLSVAKLQK